MVKFTAASAFTQNRTTLNTAVYIQLAEFFDFSLQGGKSFARVSYQRYFRRSIFPHVCWIDIDMNNSSMRSKGGKFSGYAVVEAHADCDQKIAFSHCLRVRRPLTLY